MSNNPSPSGYCLYFNSCAQGLVKTHPIKHDTSFTYPKICINQTSPFWKQLRRCRHPPTTSNDPSPSGYCASTSTLALEDSRRHIQSNTILPSHTPKYASIKHRHFGSNCGAAAIHPQRQTIPRHQATVPPLQLLHLRTREDTSNQTRYFLHTPQNMHQSNIAILEVIAALPPSTHNVKRSLTIRLLCLHFCSHGNCSRTRKDTFNQAQAFPHTHRSNIAILEAGQNHLTALVQDLPAVCASVYHQLSNQGGGPTTVDLTPSPHRIRWMTEASFQPQGGLLTRQQEALLP